MNNDVQQGPPCCLFQFEGELRADHVEGLIELLSITPADQPRHILVDCRRVNRFDEAALDALAAFQRDIEARGGKVMLVGIGHPKLLNVVFLDAHEGGNASLSGTA